VLDAYSGPPRKIIELVVADLADRKIGRLWVC
jgi:hypothetical protein